MMLDLPAGGDADEPRHEAHGETTLKKLRTWGADHVGRFRVPTVVLAGAIVAAWPAIASHQGRGPDAPAPGFILDWADEFDGDGAPDPANWAYERGFVRNQELQWYQPDNARVEHGLLVIEGRRERKPNPNYQAGSADWKRSREYADYTSSSLLTRGLHAWQYGRFEMRARIDTRAGLWPAFWTLGTSGGWPKNGEVDIMEYCRGMLLANVAWGSATPGRAVWADTRTPLTSFGADWSSRFHVWRMDWDADRIQLFVDDRKLNDVDLGKAINQDGTNINPFHQPHYLIVNLAIGGASGGDPAATTFPARYEVDYVRVFRKVAAGVR
jgi:beta-glucanase (GH16 family)